MTRLLVLFCAALIASAAAGEDATILEHVPASPDPDAHYLVYLHGRIIEVQGPEAVSPDFGRYEYRKILEAFAARGFVVVAEVRESGAGRDFVEATAAQTRRLLAAGVPARHVTVVGFSKGGLLALGVAEIVGSDQVGYAILAGCRSDPGWIAGVAPRLRGRFLSLRDRSDRFSASCQPLFEAASRVREKREHTFDTGLDHGLFYRPRRGWVDRITRWSLGEGS